MRWVHGKRGRRFARVALGLVLLAFGGCTTLPLPNDYVYFATPEPDDAWSRKIRGWQERERTVSGPAVNVASRIDPGESGALRSKYRAFRDQRKRALARQRDEMRTRIARDLHDDLGSRLGGMRLISESLLAHSELPSSVLDDLDLIHRASREATDAMRDIVWLLDNSDASRSKLISHIRQMVPSILGRMECEFTVDETPEQQLDFDFRRQILFAFKECLGNVAKHANAECVTCHIRGGAKRFTFEVRDDGEGFLVEEEDAAERVVEEDQLSTR